MEKVNPLFSVVIPLYNKADTIERTVRSVAAQTFHDWELIVVNDGSTDDSLGVARRLSSEVPMRIVDKSNGGVSSARNAGAKVARGRFIALIDGDDFWYPQHLARMANAIREHPNVGFFGGGYERTAGKYIYFTIPWGRSTEKTVYDAFRYGQPVNTSTVVVLRELWNKVGGFDERYSFYEDYEFFFRLGLHTKCCIVRSVSGRYNNDAAVQATKKHREFSRKTRPHWDFIEKKISGGSSTCGMRRYARTTARLYWALNVISGNSGTEWDFKLEFPLLVRMVGYGNRQWSGCFIEKIIANWYCMYYRFRNHMIIWRRRAR